MEGEAARGIFQGMEITVTCVKDGVKGAAQFIAFLRAMAQREKLYGETGLKRMLRTGEQVMLVSIPENRAQEFMNLAKTYGLPYHAIFAKGNTVAARITAERFAEVARQAKESGLEFSSVLRPDGAYDISFKRADMEKFNAITAKLGLTPEEAAITEINLYDIMFKRADIEKFNIIIERMGLTRDDIPMHEYTVEDVRESAKSKLEKYQTETNAREDERQWDRNQVSRMDNEEIRKTVADINGGNPEGYTPEKWQAYLEMQTVLYEYSEKNKEKIYEQRPDATMVMSKTSWADIGRTVATDAEAIKVLRPDGVVNGKQAFVPVPVYDLADTAGSEVNIRSFFTRLSDDEIGRAVEHLKSEYRVTTVAELEEGALFVPESNTIQLREGMDEDSQLQALVRESEYAQCFAEQGADAYTRENNRFRAESVTYATCAKYGINGTQYKFDYISSMKASPELLRRQKDAVLKSVSQRGKNLEKVLDRAKSRAGKER